MSSGSNVTIRWPGHGYRGGQPSPISELVWPVIDEMWSQSVASTESSVTSFCQSSRVT